MAAPVRALAVANSMPVWITSRGFGGGASPRSTWNVGSFPRTTTFPVTAGPHTLELASAAVMLEVPMAQLGSPRMIARYEAKLAVDFPLQTEGLATSTVKPSDSATSCSTLFAGFPPGDVSGTTVVDRIKTVWSLAAPSAD